MAEYLLDYSAGHIAAHSILTTAIGPNGERATGCIRYIDSPDRLRAKHTNILEWRDHLANGLKNYLVMQNTTTDADGGYPSGRANGARAKAGTDYLDRYAGVVFFANDRTTVPDPNAWRAYLDGAASVLGLGRVGAYGFGNALDLAVGHASAFWQAGAKSSLRKHANVWQDNNTQVKVGGITCDRNLVLNSIEGDMTPDQDRKLTAVYEGLYAGGPSTHNVKLADAIVDAMNYSKSVADGVYRGGPSTPDGLPLAELIGDITDFVRALDTDGAVTQTVLAKFAERLAAIELQISKLAVGGVDYAALGEAVVAALKAKL